MKSNAIKRWKIENDRWSYNLCSMKKQEIKACIDIKISQVQECVFHSDCLMLNDTVAYYSKWAGQREHKAKFRGQSCVSPPTSYDSSIRSCQIFSDDEDPFSFIMAMLSYRQYPFSPLYIYILSSLSHFLHLQKPNNPLQTPLIILIKSIQNSWIQI